MPLLEKCHSAISWLLMGPRGRKGGRDGRTEEEEEERRPEREGGGLGRWEGKGATAMQGERTSALGSAPSFLPSFLPLEETAMSDAVDSQVHI